MRRGDDDGDGGYMRRRAPGPGQDDFASHDSTTGRPRVPGKGAHPRQPRPVYTAAFGAAMAERHIRVAEDSAGRIEALTAQLGEAIASANYPESACFAFELRMAERRGRAALAEYMPGRFGEANDRATSAARDRLAAAIRNSILLVHAAPKLEASDAASEDAEHAWQATLGHAPQSVRGNESTPTWQSDTTDLASRLGLGSVDVRADDNARALADSHGARGVAFGGVVHLHRDRVQPGTSEGREVLAHELVHLAQTRLSPDHDHGRDAAEHEAADIARLLAGGGSVRTPSHYIDLARPAADHHADQGNAQADVTADFQLTSEPLVAKVRKQWLFTGTKHQPDRDKLVIVLTAMRDARQFGGLDDAALREMARGIKLPDYSKFQADVIDVRIGADLFHAYGGKPAGFGPKPLVSWLGDGLQVLVETDADLPEGGYAHPTVEQRDSVLAAMEDYTGLAPAAESVERFENVSIERVVRHQSILIRFDRRNCEALFGPDAWQQYLLQHRDRIDETRRPLSARIVQHADLVTSGEVVPIEVVVDWPPELKRPKTVNHEHVFVQWEIERIDGAGSEKPIRKRTNGLVQPKGIEHRFVLADGEARGTWRIRATVNHEQFRTAVVEDEIAVTQLDACMSDLESQAFADIAGTSNAQDHDFNPALTVVEGVSGMGAVRTAMGGPAADPYHVGKRIDGTVASGPRQSPLDSVDGDLAELDRAIEYLGDQGGDTTAAKAAHDRQAETLRGVREGYDDAIAGGATPFVVRGTYLSVGNRVASGPLRLLGTVQPALLSGKKIGWGVEITDFTERYEAKVYRFTGVGDSFDSALQSAFWDLCKSYPSGRVALLAQRIDTTTRTPTDQTVGFELDTGTAWKDVKSKIFDPVVSTAINLVGTAAMIFQPELAPVVMPALIATNSLQTVDALEDAITKHTLTVGQVLVSLGSLGLNFLPYANRIPLIKGSRLGLSVLTGVDVAGNTLVIGAQVKEQVDALRETQLRNIAQLVAEHDQLAHDNPSSPRLAELDKQIRDESDALRTALASAITTAGADNLIQVAGNYAVGAAAHTVKEAFSSEGERPAAHDEGAAGTEHETTTRSAHAATDARGGIPADVPIDRAELRNLVADKYASIVQKYTSADHTRRPEYQALIDELKQYEPGALGTDEMSATAKDILDRWARIAKQIEHETGRSERDLRELYNMVEKRDMPVWLAAIQGVPKARQAELMCMFREELRLFVRDLMLDENSKEVLYLRDLAVYGRRGGPTFDQLVERATARAGDIEKAYDSIIDSSQRSNKSVNKTITGNETGIVEPQGKGNSS